MIIAHQVNSRKDISVIGSSDTISVYQSIVWKEIQKGTTAFRLAVASTKFCRLKHTDSWHRSDEPITEVR